MRRHGSELLNVSTFTMHSLELYGTLLGMAAAGAFILQYVLSVAPRPRRRAVSHRVRRYFPQMVLNYRRKSMYGFSFHGILIKHLGACFLFVNSYVSSGACFRRSVLPLPRQSLDLF